MTYCYIFCRLREMGLLDYIQPNAREAAKEYLAHKEIPQLMEVGIILVQSYLTTQQDLGVLGVLGFQIF